METELGYPWDISFDDEMREDVIYLDAGDTSVTLTIRDIQKLLEALGE